MHYRYLTLEQRRILENVIRNSVQSEPARSTALSRLGEPDFGTCIECGKEIPYALLEADPAALHCRECGRLPVA
jgi:RNA polymerase-binding transcription factor DksA